MSDSTQVRQVCFVGICFYLPLTQCQGSASQPHLHLYWFNSLCNAVHGPHIAQWIYVFLALTHRTDPVYILDPQSKSPNFGVFVVTLQCQWKPFCEYSIIIIYIYIIDTSGQYWSMSHIHIKCMHKSLIHFGFQMFNILNRWWYILSIPNVSECDRV